MDRWVGALLVAVALAGCASAPEPPISAYPASSLASAGSDNAFIAPGERLPTGRECRAKVRPTREHKPINAKFNRMRGTAGKLNGKGKFLARVDGDFTGTTDEILQWGACKWGVPADMVRALAVVESFWKMTEQGDWSSHPNRCAPGHAVHSPARPGECAESLGILQVRYPYHYETFPDAALSTAYNVDYALAVWRECYEGEEKWLREREAPGHHYRPADALGCFGRWASGRWYSERSKWYMQRVLQELRARRWETEPHFDRH